MTTDSNDNKLTYKTTSVTLTISVKIFQVYQHNLKIIHLYPSITISDEPTIQTMQ